MRLNLLLLLFFFLSMFSVYSQSEDTTNTYKKRVLENTEVEFFSSYYKQDGRNAAVSGGIGTEALSDVASSLVVSIPLNDDDILVVDGSVSAYSSASSSNIDPFDTNHEGDPYVASSGASSGDVWLNAVGTYSHSSDDRNKIWSVNLSGSTEHDYSSFGIGGSFARMFNHQNTEISLHGNVFLDTWLPIYPAELRPFLNGGGGLRSGFFYIHNITGNKNYNPGFTEFTNVNRNSYSLGFGFSQILSKRLQFLISGDFVLQSGLLSTPFQRVYFSDVQASYIENFRLADDIERLPDQRKKLALGGMFNYYLNERIVIRAFYRYYKDDWGIVSNTVKLEIPAKISTKFTLYPSIRLYDQSAAAYFAPFARHLSTDQFYTSDYDLSGFYSWQPGFGISYTDIFTSFKIGQFGLKSFDFNIIGYRRNSGLMVVLLSGGVKFVME